ncbi:chromosome segregation protein SMC [Arenibaculum pallidiluteum]|uniref:chromosome segregation protein SMC n=1 Tax=Arenibaculum pallidiluteum TaxID=2812559 RepID=UPI001A971A89|nr:chromosome segregation protein SMC [Arenibaculum pallidiluteum]
MQFVKLRLSGFKSFVDATELVIEPGMTGIVGPNGCGKSNLVEALRWVMGETSAKRMRGDDMDDVIFGGTDRRPARNVAEVSLLIDNRRRTAPAGFNEFDDLEVIRRIERGSGSDYRINGKSVRARDVQLLFQDNASGANSPALVSQGRIGALINARPTERRSILEEAAGITGLHSRRHEAELRLKAAEQNLVRLDDVIAAMDTQLGGLRKQARQASRYRNLSEHIRQAEAAQLHLRWIAAQTQLARARAGFEAAEATVRELMARAAHETAQRTDAAAGLPELRRAEQAAAAQLQRLVVEREQLDAEERRIAEARTANERRLAQVATDLTRERALSEDAGAALARLTEEREGLIEAQGEESLAEEEARAALDEAREAVDALDRELSRLTEQAAADEARRAAAQREAAELERRRETAARRLDETRRQREQLEAELAAAGDLGEAEEALAAAEERLEIAREQAEGAEQARAAAERDAARAREALQAAEGTQAKLRAEEKGLAELLATAGGKQFPPLVDALTVEPGWEAALAAALGDALTAPLDEAAPVHWRTLPAYATPPALPAGAAPLAARVRAPAALERCLALVGVVADEASARAMMAGLQPGQVLVGREGGCWRWDGFSVAPGAPTAAAVRLRQRNRLAELRTEIEAAADGLVALRDGLEAARRAGEQAADGDRAAREAVRAAFAETGRAREAQARLAQATAASKSRLGALDEAVERLEGDLEEVAALAVGARSALIELPEPAAVREAVAELRASLAERRADLANRQNALDRLAREAQARRQRLGAIEAEAQGWRSRSVGADERLAELRERAEQARAELETLADRPAEIAAERSALLDRIAEAERSRRRAADTLAEAERSLAEAERRLRQSETDLGSAREERVRAEAAVAAAMQAGEAVRERIVERLECTPEQVRELAGFDEGEPLPELASVEQRLERLVRERETMGPVNLLAEREASELEQQITAMQTEREDLTAAIGRLRQGISSLNKEARERLLASFETVAGHFEEMFTRLFGGGRAQLKLTEAEDPLDAGLEIYASPPGKKLQILSLLSGGEQALTALALLFAVFLTNPAPICVLDEVDAPLDEANVDRFVAMVEEMARRSGTRFLLITHHRLTMARMDRLFGVTMGERGVSQLVSVDLNAAEELRGAA